MCPVGHPASVTVQRMISRNGGIRQPAIVSLAATDTRLALDVSPLTCPFEPRQGD